MRFVAGGSYAHFCETIPAVVEDGEEEEEEECRRLNRFNWRGKGRTGAESCGWGYATRPSPPRPLQRCQS